MSAAAYERCPAGVGIVGGGLLGLTVGYRLARRGVPVTVYEASGQLGGLAGTTDLRRVRRGPLLPRAHAHRHRA